MLAVDCSPMGGTDDVHRGPPALHPEQFALVWMKGMGSSWTFWVGKQSGKRSAHVTQDL